jgi:4-amino-4-deoxy-L-arabinose transferase-like glycosyltransferase
MASTTPATGVEIPSPRSLTGRLRAVGRRLVLGRAEAATWERPTLLGLLLATAVLYFSNLTASGWANSFYSAAAQAGSVNWEAFFYGSSDAGNSITVDKPPMSLWFMALSVRIFGLSSFSILLPEVLMGVATVAVVYATVRRRFSAGTALLAGAALAITPVAALMFRFNNPDALLVLLLSLASYFTVRGVEDGRIRWVLWAGTMVGFAFLTKQLQAFLILPVLAGVYLWMAPPRFGKRLLHALAALGAVVVSAGWWVAIVELVPASMRPYIGGSQTNSFLELTFGYNGFGRLTGEEVGSVTGGGQATGGMWGSTGINRLFIGDIGGQITWLLPAGFALILVALLLLRRAPRVSVRRAIVVVFAGWLVVTFLAFSFMAGIFHAYYTVALAPPLAAVVAIGAGLLWHHRVKLWSRIVSAVVVLGTAGWAFVLLTGSPGWMPWLKFVIVALGVAGAVLLVLPPRGRRWAVATASIALGATLLGPLAYTVQTVSVGHTGSIVTAGPGVTTTGFGGPAGGFGGQGGQAGGAVGQPGGGFGGGQPPTGPGAPTGAQPTTTGGQVAGGPAAGGQAGGPGGVGGGTTGGLLQAAQVSDEVAATLSVDSSSYTWAAAAVGSNRAAGYQLATGLAVMPLGGFNGSDPSPTLEQFEAYVAAGSIHYFVGGTERTPNGGSEAAGDIAAWVQTHFTAHEVGGITMYDLTEPR